MEIKLIVSVLSLIILACHAQEWEDIKGPLDSPHYKEIVDKIYASAGAVDQTNTGKIAGGSLATLGQFPYQVYMYTTDGVGNIYICGGTIVARRWILTAAHCLAGFVHVQVYFGTIDRVSPFDPTSIKRINVTGSDNIIPHPSYNENIFANDIGLVRLPSDAPIEDAPVGLVTLQQANETSSSLVGVQGTVSGFGLTSDLLGSQPSFNLRYVRLPIAANSNCAAIFGTQLVTDANVCIHSPASSGSACQGDSGGPLTVELNGRTVQVGVVSFGATAGCTLGYPQVFTRVTTHLTWINSHTSSSSTFSRFFTILSLPALAIFMIQYSAQKIYS